MLGLPVTTWIMILLSGGIGIAIEAAFLVRQRRRRSRKNRATHS